MALSTEQKDLAKALAGLVGTTLHLVPDQVDVKEYVDLINTEISAIATAPASDNPIKDETEAALAVLAAIVPVIPDSAKGKKKFAGVVSFITGLAHIAGF